MEQRRGIARLAIPLTAVATAVVLLVIFYYPVGTVIQQAFAQNNQLSIAPLLNIVTDPFYRELFAFTAYQAVISTVASVCLGLPGAYILSQFEFTGRRTIRSLTMLPFVLPSILVAVGFLAMFGENGFLNDLLTLFGFPTIDIAYSLEMIVVAHAFYNAPLVTRLVTAGWESIDGRQIETARAMGATPMQAFRDVVIPQLLPITLTAALLSFIFAFMSFPIVLALGGLRLATVEVWIYASIQNLNLSEAAALATIETGLSLLLLYIYLRYEARQTEATVDTASRPRQPLIDGWGSVLDVRRIGIFLYGGIAAVVFAGPIFSLVIESFSTTSGMFTLTNYEFLVQQQAATAQGTTKPLPAIVNSLLFGGGTLLLALPMGVIVAVIATRDNRGSRFAEAILTAPLAVSGVVVGIGLLQTHVFGTTIFGRQITIVGPVAIVFAHAIAAYPFVTRNVAPALGRIDSRLIDAARSLGAPRVRTLIDVELPIIAPAIAGGMAFAFAISIGEFDSTVLLASNVDSYTMPVALERYIGNRSIGPSLGPATAMGTVLLVITAASFVLIDRFSSNWEL